MEFIRHLGELTCDEWGGVEEKRVIYYAIADDKQVYWFVCGHKACGHWTRVSFEAAEAGPLKAATRKKYAKLKKFEETGEVSHYGTNW
jgi:hypothetical protein